MRGKLVAPAARQVVDEQLVAEAVFASPVDAMGFEWIAAVWAEQGDSPLGSKHPRHFSDRRPVVLHVLDHLVAQYEIEALGAERQVLAGRVHDVRRAPGGLTRPLKIVF